MVEKLEDNVNESHKKEVESKGESSCSVPNPGYSNMVGRPTGHKHDAVFDDYSGFSNYSGPSGHRH